MPSSDPAIKKQIDAFENDLDQMARFYDQAMAHLAVEQMRRGFEPSMEDDPPAWQVLHPDECIGLRSPRNLAPRFVRLLLSFAKLLPGTKKRQNLVFYDPPIIIDVAPEDVIEPERFHSND